MKRHVLLSITVILISVASAFAQSGKTGPLTWKLKKGTLTISGTGAMPDYEEFDAPWHIYKESINSVTIETGVTTIGDKSFYACSKLTSITIPSSVTTIGNDAFKLCNRLTLITIPSNVTTIGSYAFMRCDSLASITVPSSVTTIESSVFSSCSSLTSITIPSSVTTIRNFAFERCRNLTSITNLNPVPFEISPYVFSGVNQSTCTLKVPKNAVSAYKNTEVWKEFTIVGIENN